jgi:acyl transferase domain-containing protein
VEAIFRALHLPDDRRILVGGVKPSLGHSEGASGLSSVVKVMLSLEHATIPATIGVNEVNPNIKCAEWHTDLVTKCMPWPASVSMRASINAFGFGGANSHVIVEAPQPKKAENLSPSGMLGKSARNDIKGGISNKTPHEAPAFILLSARTWKSLEQVVQDLARWCSETSLKDKICDLEYTLNTRRSRLETRTFLLIPQPHLPAHANLEDLPSNDIGKSTPLPLAFVFTGQGAQWTGMGKELYHQYDTFRSSIDQLDAHLQSLPPAHMPKWRIADVLTLVDTETSIHTADVCQPICSAVQIALVDLLRVWNIKPRYAVGHSSGEIAAAYAAGLLSAYDAILVAYFRGIAVAEHSGNGAMIATTLRPEEAKDFVRKQGFNESVSVACFNAPQSTTLSGDQQAIDKAFKLLQKKKCFVKRLSTDSKAYHSKHMNSVSEKYRDLLDTYWKKADGLQNRDLHQTDNTHDIVFNSTVTRNAISKDQIQSPGYWVQNLVSPVLFSEAMTTIMQECRCHFLELGPHSSLQLPLKEIQLALNSGDDELLYNSALRRETNGVITMLSLLGSLFVQGHDTVDFGRASPNLQHSHRKPTTLHDLPTYPWDYTDSIRPRQSRTVEEFRSRKYPRHELLGSSIPGGSRFTRAWRNILDVNETPWLKDHRLGPSIVFPAAAYIAMAAEAVSQAHDITTSQCHGIELRRVNFLKALNLDEERRSRVEVVTELRPHSITAVRSSDKWWEFTVTSIHDDAGTTTHVNALVAVNESPEPLYRHVKNDCKSLSRENTSKWYDKFHKEGLNWGPEFAVMQDIHTDRSRQECFARSKTRLRRGLKRLSHDQYEYIAHPVNIDGMLQTAFVATTAGWVRDLRATVPVSMESVRISCSALANFDSNAEWFYDAASTKVGCGTVSIDAELYNTSDEVLIHMEKVRCIPYQGNVQRQGRRARQRLARIEWKPDLSMLQTSDNDGHLEYIRWYTERIPSSMKDRSLNDRHALALLDLAVHKNPNGRVVYLGPESTFVDAMKITLRTDQQLRRCASFHTGCLDLNGTFNLASMIAQDEDLDGNRPDKLFDTVVCDRVSHTVI